MALRPSDKSLSTELWTLLASWHVTLRKREASTMRTCLLTTFALGLGLGLDRLLKMHGRRVGVGLCIHSTLHLGLHHRAILQPVEVESGHGQ